MSSLIPERTIVISPSLAATIGLEEAVLLHTLSAIVNYQTQAPANGWHRVDAQRLQELCPFWSVEQLQRVSKALADKGIVRIDSAPLTQSGELAFRFDQDRAPQKQPAKAAAVAEPQATPMSTKTAARGANRISPNWWPGDDILQKIAQHNIPRDFALRQVTEFVTYWRDRNEVHYSWDARFLKSVQSAWRDYQSNPRFAVTTADAPRYMAADWQPSNDALEILAMAGINRAFIEDAIPEFVLYWREKGDATTTWNSKFVQHVKRQWARYASALEHDTEPRRINPDWQPSKDVFDILKLANIDADFARGLVNEFVLFWREANELTRSWNTKFLQHVKHHWARRHQLGYDHARQQNANGPGSANAAGFIERHADRSWADGL
jgi:hypothetical protein